MLPRPLPLPSPSPPTPTPTPPQQKKRECEWAEIPTITSFAASSTRVYIATLFFSSSLVFCCLIYFLSYTQYLVHNIIYKFRAINVCCAFEFEIQESKRKENMSWFLKYLRYMFVVVVVVDVLVQIRARLTIHYYYFRFFSFPSKYRKWFVCSSFEQNRFERVSFQTFLFEFPRLLLPLCVLISFYFQTIFVYFSLPLLLAPLLLTKKIK